MDCAQLLGAIFFGQPYMLGYKEVVPPGLGKAARLGFRLISQRNEAEDPRAGSTLTTEQNSRFPWRSLRLWGRKMVA